MDPTGVSPLSNQVRQVGDYLVHDAFGAGGMATVHWGSLRSPAGFQRLVAVKRLRADLLHDPKVVGMLLDEARLAGRIHHPNVVATHDVVLADHEVFIVMDYVHGESLAKLLRSASLLEQPVPTGVVAAILCDVLRGLHAAHEATDAAGAPLGIVHRDVSPQNVVVGEDGVARLLDFGIAKAIGRSHTTLNGEVRGKLAYLPPEVLRGARPTRRADIYGAAVLLWELLTRQRLFTGSGATLVEHVLSGDVDPPSAIDPDVTSAFDGIVMRGLAREPDRRFPSAREMALAIEGAVVLASPVEVGAWVTLHGGEELPARAARIASLEAVVSPPAPAPLPPFLAALPRPQRGPAVRSSRRSSSLVVAAAAAGALTIAMGFWVPRASAPDREPVAAGTTTSVLDDAPPTELPGDEPSTAPLPEDRAAITPARGGAVHRAPRARPRTSKDVCSPIFDERGRKHWRCQ